jgi:hypothetical protein
MNESSELECVQHLEWQWGDQSNVVLNKLAMIHVFRYVTTTCQVRVVCHRPRRGQAPSSPFMRASSNIEYDVRSPHGSDIEFCKLQKTYSWELQARATKNNYF